MHIVNLTGVEDADVQSTFRVECSGAGEKDWTEIISNLEMRVGAIIQAFSTKYGTVK